jgi:phage-related protein
MAGPARKPITWMGSSKKDLRGFPAEVRREIGTALFWAEQGQLHPAAKLMKGNLREVTEIVSNYEGDAFRAMYTMRIGDEVYVLHAFQKKSKKGIATPQHELDVIEGRLKAARQLHTRRASGRQKR